MTVVTRKQFSSTQVLFHSTRSIRLVKWVKDANCMDYENKPNEEVGIKLVWF
jgi:hypothetical protein